MDKEIFDHDLSLSGIGWYESRKEKGFSFLHPALDATKKANTPTSASYLNILHGSKNKFLLTLIDIMRFTQLSDFPNVRFSVFACIKPALCIRQSITKP